MSQPQYTDISRALWAMSKVERNMEELYAWYAELFAHDEEATELFARLSREEKGHGNLVDFHRRLATGSRQAFEAVLLDLSQVNDLNTKIENLRAAEKAPRLDQAVSDALMFEASSTEFLLTDVLRKANPSLGQIVDGMIKENEEHFKRLQTFAEARKMLVWVDAREAVGE